MRNTINNIIDEIEINFRVIRAYIDGKTLEEPRVTIKDNLKIVDNGRVNYDQALLSIIGLNYFIDSLNAFGYDTRKLRDEYNCLIDKCLIVRNFANN